MTISGLWHGAAWNFVIWGMYHGLLLIGHKFYLKLLDKSGLATYTHNVGGKIISIVIFFPLVAIGWVFFRQGDIGLAFNMISQMLTTNPLAIDFAYMKYFAVIGLLYLAHVMEYLVIVNRAKLGAIWVKYLPTPVRALVYTALIVIVTMFLQSQTTSFIYFQF